MVQVGCPVEKKTLGVRDTNSRMAWLLVGKHESQYRREVRHALAAKSGSPVFRLIAAVSDEWNCPKAAPTQLAHVSRQSALLGPTVEHSNHLL